MDRNTANLMTGQKIAADFNARHPVGTPVKAWPGARNEDPLITVTRTPVWVLGHGTPVVSVKGYAGGINLAHIEVITDLDETQLMDAVQDDPEPEPVSVPGKVTYEAARNSGDEWTVYRVIDPIDPVRVVTYDSQTAADAVALFLNAWSHREV